MNLSRLRVGEWVALIGGIGLLVLLFTTWFGVDAGAAGTSIDHSLTKSGWGGLGWFMVLLLLVLIAGGLFTAATVALGQPPAGAVGVAVATLTLGGVIVLALAVRLLLQPDLGVGADNGAVDVRLPALLGLVFAALIPAGAFWAIQDERTAGPEAVVNLPPARPVPGTPA
jgi:hypothetical protein